MLHGRIGITRQTDRLNFRVPKAATSFAQRPVSAHELVDFVEIALSPLPSKTLKMPHHLFENGQATLSGQFREFRHIAHAATPFCAASPSLSCCRAVFRGGIELQCSKTAARPFVLCDRDAGRCSHLILTVGTTDIPGPNSTSGGSSNTIFTGTRCTILT